MTKTEDVAVEREVATMHEELAERRAERDLQSAIRLQNLKYWTMFTIAERTEYAPRQDDPASERY